MTVSRALGMASGAGAFLSGVSAAFNLINPKTAAFMAALGGSITMFCERAHGSPEYRRRKRQERSARLLDQDKPSRFDST